MRSATRCAPRAGFRCDRHGVPRLPARRSRPARGPAPARPALGCGDPSLRASLSLRTAETLPRGRLPAVLRSRRRRPANGCIRWLPEVSTISPYHAPSALAAGFRTLPRGRLRKPSAHVSQRRCMSVEERWGALAGRVCTGDVIALGYARCGVVCTTHLARRRRGCPEPRPSALSGVRTSGTPRPLALLSESRLRGRGV